jgi:hypothetical protein
MLLTILPATDAPAPKPRPPTALCASYRRKARYVSDHGVIAGMYAYSRPHASRLELESILLPRLGICHDSVVASRGDDGGSHRSLGIRNRCESELIMRALWRRNGGVAVLVLLIWVRVVSRWRRWCIRLLSWLLILLLIRVLVGWREGVVLLRWRSDKAWIRWSRVKSSRCLLDIVGGEEADLGRVGFEVSFEPVGID